MRERKGMTSNTGTKAVFESFEKRPKEAAKKAEKIGKKRTLGDTDDSDSDATGVKTTPSNTRKDRQAPVKNPCITVPKPRLTSRKKEMRSTVATIGIATSMDDISKHLRSTTTRKTLYEVLPLEYAVVRKSGVREASPS